MPTPKHNPKVDAYAEKVEDFAKPILAHLRTLIHATCPDVTEEIKWGIPHFDYKGDMMCIFAAYKKHCSFTFYKDALMEDARLKANDGVPAAKRFMGKLTNVADLPSDKELKAWIKESMALNEQGLKLPARESKTPKEVAIPAAFVEKLQANPKIAKISKANQRHFKRNTTSGLAMRKPKQHVKSAWKKRSRGLLKVKDDFGSMPNSGYSPELFRR